MVITNIRDAQSIRVRQAARKRIAHFTSKGYVSNVNGNAITVELDSATAEVLDRLAQAWGVSQADAVRRAVSEAGAVSAEPAALSRLQAFKELQRRLQLTPERAASWCASVREGRR